MQSSFTTPRNSFPRIWPRRTRKCTIVSSLDLLIPLARQTPKIIINIFLACKSCRLSLLNWLSRPLARVMRVLRLNSQSQSSFLSKYNLLFVCRSKLLIRSSLLTVLRRLESWIKHLSQSQLLSSLPSFLLKMTLIGSLISCLRSLKPLLFCSRLRFTAGKWRIGLTPAKVKPWLLQ